MKKLLDIFKLLGVAVAFLSWIPVPQWAVAEKDLHRMAIFFPLAGALFGGLAAVVLCASSLIFPYAVSIALTLLVYGWITGAFHEDGLADVADGMGGYEPDRILEIMKDSRVGTYGAFALISTYVLRYTALSSIEPSLVVRNLIAYAAVSRTAGALFLILPSAREIPPESLSRTVSFSGQWVNGSLAVALAAAVVYLTRPTYYELIPILVLGTVFLSRIYFKKRLGFVTGDCAGFVVYVTETALHVMAAASL